MLLVSPAAVRTLLGFDDITRVTLQLRSALSAATQALASDLRAGDFTREVGREDLFFIRPGSVLHFGSGVAQRLHTRLALSRGFLAAVPVIKHHPSLGLLNSEGLTLSAEYLKIDLTKGEAVIAGADLRGQYVSVVYTCGFSVPEGATGDNAGVFNPEEVPTWLKDACAQKAIDILLATQPELAGETPPAGRKELASIAAGILESRIRYFPNAIHPAI